MAEHPDVFLTREEFKEALRDVGCDDGYLDAAASDFSIIMPLLFHALGRRRIYEIVEGARPEVLLNEAPTAWDRSIYYFVRLFDNEIDQFRQRKIAEIQRRNQQGQQGNIP